ncbi:MAG: glucose-6-phosphate isomerase family protein [Terrimicrobiaceae bacterium]
MLGSLHSIGERFDISDFGLTGGREVVRRLSDLAGCFADAGAYRTALAVEDSVLYRVVAVEPASGPGDLHYGLGIVYPGKIGNEYYLTKGHLHETRDAAEVYIGQSGEGLMLLEDERTRESRVVPLGAGQIVYVPGHTAHRTMNTGTTPLTYFGIYPANAGHDYGAIAERNFLKVVIEENGRPVMKDRNAL